LTIPLLGRQQLNADDPCSFLRLPLAFAPWLRFYPPIGLGDHQMRILEIVAPGAALGLRVVRRGYRPRVRFAGRLPIVRLPEISA
jgi:hypothetical protein